MRAVVQRVTHASVVVAGQTVGAIGPGLLCLVSAGHGDGPVDVRYITDKIVGLRVFEDAAGKMNHSLLDLLAAGQPASVLVVSQFTLHGDVRKGKRPSFTAALEPVQAAKLVEQVASGVAAQGLTVARGVFGADMQVSLCNDGPVTILLDSQRLF
jgi:D-tyrosyl-tRNA(Tyr) deacylase